MIDTGPVGGEVTFAEGLPGFEGTSRFVLVAAPSLDPFMLVRGLEDGDPAFLAIDPRQVVPDYQLDLNETDLARLDARPGQPLLWLAVVTAKTEGKATVNLRAPLVVSPASMRGLQLVRDHTGYPLDHPLAGD